ncbi:murein hydrolase activator EnvC [Asticcacaulis sp. AC402]|uniref:murein hydrolase activator EnvC family protein n=1 Tax=Asticcacaulis sp. AC402 TaxID=1282361 RepID=UPI0003C3EBBC|nr:peptidoglycan DD-metalloendopeptidase family protein [Asticcacaulis sp. AC402]ESQ77302.1 peptidase M23 [Asticcacaulis sp. AC402]
MHRSSYRLLLTGFAVFALAGAMQSDANVRIKPLSAQDQADLDALSAQRRAEERKSDQTRQTARQIALEAEDLRQRIIDISKKQGVSEQRAAIYRAKLETLNLQEVDITRRLTTERAKQAKLLSALQIYSRNPPPALLINPRRANDAVLAAIIMKAITPELEKRTQSLVKENAQLVNVRRQAALQNEALFISESEVSSQRREIEGLIRQKIALEDKMLKQADRMDANVVVMKAREDRMRGQLPLRGMLGNDSSRLGQPVVGEKVRDFGQVGGQIGGQSGVQTGGPGSTPSSRGVYYAAQPGSQVTAPAEGEVEYAGPLASYGQVVILGIGNNYHVVLTGLGRIYVDKGQTVGRGEPVGRMPNLSDKKTLLYMELRRGEDPVNPGNLVPVSGR